MREILSRRGIFTQEELNNLEAREDYEALQEQVEGMNVDELLDTLAERSEEILDEDTHSLEERWEHFKTTLRELIAEREAVQGETEETLDEMRERITSEARTRAEEAIRNRVSWIPLIGERIGNWIIETMQQDQDETSSSFQSVVRNVLFALATSIFGLRGVVQAFNNEVFDARNRDLPQAPDLPPVPDEITGVAEEIVEENGDELLYEAGITALLSLSQEDNETTRSLLMHRSIKTSSFEVLLASDFHIEDIQQEEIIILQNTLRSQEFLFESLLHESQPNWRSLPLLDIFKAFGSYGDIVGTFDSIRLEDFLEGGFNMFSLNISADGVGGNLRHLFENLRNDESNALHGVSNGLILLLLRDNRKKISDEDIEALLAGNDYSTPEDQRFEADFIEFGREFINIIISDFYLGDETQRERFEAYFRTNSLTLQEVFEFYILTGGSRNPESYNDMVRTLIYLKVWKILGRWEWGNELRAATYNSFIIGVLDENIEEGRERLPESFWTLVERLRNATISGAREIISNGASMIYEAFNSLSRENQIIVSVMSIGAVIFIVRGRVFRARASGLALGLSAGAMLYFMSEEAYGSESFRAAHPELSSPDDVYNGMLDELEQEHGLNVTALREARESGEIETSEERTDRRRQALIDELAEDGMELAGVSEYTIGPLTVRRLGEEWRNYELAFYINGERRRIYYHGWHGESIANNRNRNAFFVRNNEDQIFLALHPLFGGGDYRFVNLHELSERIETSEQEEYIIIDNSWPTRDLYLEGFSR